MPEEQEKVLTFAIERDGDTAIVKCHGRLVAGATEELYREVKDLLPQTKTVVVDLAELTYVDSSGLGTLVRLHAPPGNRDASSSCFTLVSSFAIC